MGQDWLGQVCEAQSEATLVGMKFPRLEGFFAKGYRETAPAGALSPNAVFRGILGACSAQGLRSLARSGCPAGGRRLGS